MSTPKTRLTKYSIGQLITEGARQLFGTKTPNSLELTGLRKYFNSYTLLGRRNCVLATYGVLVVTVATYLMHRQNKKEKAVSDSATCVTDL